MAETSPTTESVVAARYAQALYDAAFEHKVLDRVIDEMASLGRLIEQSEALQKLIGGRGTDAAKASSALDNALREQGFSDLVRNYVRVTLANRRLGELPQLVRSFAAYVAGKRGEVTADVITAHPLTDVQRNQLRARLTESGYGNVNLRETVDPNVLGGLSLKIGAKLYDTTLKSRLDRLTFSLKGA